MDGLSIQDWSNLSVCLIVSIPSAVRVAVMIGK